MTAAETDVHPPLAWPAYRSTVLRAPGRKLVELPRTISMRADRVIE